MPDDQVLLLVLRIRGSLLRVIASAPPSVPGGPLAGAVDRVRRAMNLDGRAPGPAPDPRTLLGRMAYAGLDLLDELAGYRLVDTLPVPPP
ncbi:hypothetical protein [Streptomyces sp. NPDC015350]|uniref:hypothetical protein n=1 Tax=Streptomyces sp. NPDC015350 TaxID=3364955 RepID=UPI0036FED75F